MSKINLPPLPKGVSPDQGIGNAMCVYAEQAVREALETLAKAISAQADVQRLNYQRFGCNRYYEGMADGLDVAEQKVLALIPENSDGDTP
ncbi:hypothetical protein D3C87_1005560 [compost metagenome]